MKYKKMLRNVSEILRANFPATKNDFSMAKIAHLDDSFWEIFEREESSVEV